MSETMPPPTEDQIRLAAPHAWGGYVDALIAGWPEIEAAGINTPLRWSHFLAQCCHETGGLTIVRENTGWTAEQMCSLWPDRFKTKLDPRILLARGDPEALANVAYSGRADLGNLGGGDGWDYRGGGLLQLTGRAAYAECGEAIRLDLEDQPELIEGPHVSLKAALWVWSRHNLNQFADRNLSRVIGNAINRGNPYSKLDPIGFKSREKWLRLTQAAFCDGHSPQPTDGSIDLGDHGTHVRRIQVQLRDLGYQVGAEDGVYGPTMARAVAAFKRDQLANMGVGLETGDTIGPLTLAALDTAHPVALSPDRENMTARELEAQGSTEMKAGHNMQNVGRALTATGAGLALDQAGILDQLANSVQTLSPVIRSLQWTGRNWFWVLLVAGGVWCWRSGYFVQAARLAAHRLGLNLSR